MLKVGLTGGIGAGKSAVAGRLQARGAVLIDSDVLAREVVAAGGRGLTHIVDAFGVGVLDAAGGLDRAAMAERVFDDEIARSTLEEIIHPLVRERARELTAAAPGDAIVVNDVPLLAEVGLAPTFDLVVVVQAPEDVRVERLINRGLAEAQARARIAAQTADETRRAVADVVIDNGGTPEQLDDTVSRLWSDRLVPFEENKRLRRRVVSPQNLRHSEHRRSWDADYARVAARLRYVLGETAVHVDHIGSTAVTGLPAKPVLDVQITVPSLAAADQSRNALEAAGFPATDVTSDTATTSAAAADGGSAVLSRRQKRLHGGTDPALPVHIHVRAAGSAGARSALLLRDWLRDDANAREEYAAVKTRLKDVAASASHYAELKEPVVSAMLPRAEEWARRTGWTVP